MARPIRVVVGEGRTAQQGLLRFVLEGEGFEIVGEASGTADLTRVLGEQRPDVVVLDDGIGVIAVSMVHEVLPDTKIVLVWPSAVVPIGGDARVEPAQILEDLGPTIRQVAGAAAAASVTETFARPAWIDRVRKDPTTLRDKLDQHPEVSKRPSVTELQRRGRRLHPGKKTSPKPSEERIPAPVVVLPVGAGDAPGEPVLDIGGGTASETSVPQERSEWNRRLGSLALSGAAAVSALVLALALGGGRVPVSIVRGGGDLPPGLPEFVSGASAGPFGAGSLGGSGYTPFVPATPQAEEEPSGERPDAGSDEPSGGTEGPDTEEPGDVPEQPDEEPGDGGGNDGGGGGGNGGGGNGGGGNGGGGGGGNGGGGPVAKPRVMPGKSAEHNPFGGPPSKLGMTPRKDEGGLGKAAKESQEREAKDKPRHAHKH